MKKKKSILAASAAAALAFLAAPASAMAVDSTADSTAPETPLSTNILTGTPAANGAVTFASDEAELTVLPAPETDLSDEELAQLQNIITCTINVQHVHPSSHVSGTINGIATIGCDATVASLTLHYSLIRVSPNNTQWGAPTVSNSGELLIQNNRAIPCSEGPGDFQGWGQGEMVPPAGYELVGSGLVEDYGTMTNVVCGSSAANEEPGTSEAITITFVRSDLTSE